MSTDCNGFLLLFILSFPVLNDILNTVKTLLFSGSTFVKPIARLLRVCSVTKKTTEKRINHIMFWHRKMKKAENTFQAAVLETLNSITTSLRTQDEKLTILENLKGKTESLETAIRRQSDSFEDLLDTFEDHRKDISILEQELDNVRHRENALLQLCCNSRDQLDLIRQRLADDPAWAEQFRLLDKESSGFMRAASLLETGKPGEPVSYEIHQVLNAVDTSDRSLDKTVFQVYRRGRVYNGKVISKAQVSAYRFTGHPDMPPEKPLPSGDPDH